MAVRRTSSYRRGLLKLIASDLTFTVLTLSREMLLGASEIDLSDVTMHGGTVNGSLKALSHASSIPLQSPLESRLRPMSQIANSRGSGRDLHSPAVVLTFLIPLVLKLFAK